MKLFQQPHLRDSMPMVQSQTEIFTHECASALPDTQSCPGESILFAATKIRTVWARESYTKQVRCSSPKAMQLMLLH
jgi:hypothetical protein